MTDEKNQDGLGAIIKQIQGQKHPPVHLWNPDFCGDLDMRIARDGTWFYMGSPIGRKPLVKLFSGVIRLDENEKYYLVTPVEKIGITVDDAPFVAVEMFCEGEGREQILSFRTNVDDFVIMDADHPFRIEIDPETKEPAPYVRVRSNLDALIARSVFYDLVNLAAEEDIKGNRIFGFWSSGQFFELGLMDDIFDNR
ncbi:MAG: proteophosphoglycan precursor [Sneathiella sp.]|nr:MAG: proteophosphoglycan precursor [Sneathiella sp.]